MNLLNILNQIEKTDPEVYDRVNDRRSAVKNFASISGKLALTAVPFALSSVFQKAYGRTTNTLDEIIAVLNFALTLEYLEAEFYIAGVASGVVPTAMGDRKAIEKIRDHEIAHVKVLTTTINSLKMNAAVAKPKFDFTAKGTFSDVFTNYGTFLAVSQTFEDTGVRAYKGQAGNLMSNNAILTAALRIHSVEARHAAHVREMRRRNGFNVNIQPWIRGNDSFIGPVVQASYAGEENTDQFGVQIININGYKFTRDDASEAFDEPLSKEQVLKIVAPFIA